MFARLKDTESALSFTNPLLRPWTKLRLEDGKVVGCERRYITPESRGVFIMSERCVDDSQVSREYCVVNGRALPPLTCWHGHDRKRAMDRAQDAFLAQR
jgi:hypothetical protein